MLYCFCSLNEEQLNQAKEIIHTNIFDSYEETISDPKVLELLAFYRISRDDAEKAMRKEDALISEI